MVQTIQKLRSRKILCQMQWQSAVPVTAIAQSPSLPVSVPQTFADAYGNQFFMVPVSMGQAPPMIQTAPKSGQMNFNSGSRGVRNQKGGRGFRGRFNRGSTKHSGIFYAYCMDSALHHLIFLKIK